MLAYAMMLSVSKTLGYRTFLEDRVLENLGRYFPDIGRGGDGIIMPVESLCYDQFPWEEFGVPVDLLAEDRVRRGHALEISPTVSNTNAM